MTRTRARGRALGLASDLVESEAADWLPKWIGIRKIFDPRICRSIAPGSREILRADRSDPLRVESDPTGRKNASEARRSLRHFLRSAPLRGRSHVATMRSLSVSAPMARSTRRDSERAAEETMRARRLHAGDVRLLAMRTIADLSFRSSGSFRSISSSSSRRKRKNLRNSSVGKIDQKLARLSNRSFDTQMVAGRASKNGGRA